MTKTRLTPTAERLLFKNKEKELLRKLILALSEHPQISHYLWKHHIIYESDIENNEEKRR